MKRIFWLGMHKLLVRTELVRLRKLGYEVFNPPYLSPVYDQSANLDWDSQQPTTLPREVFEALSQHNFFYNSVPEPIAELLNTYFDTVVVTINPDWLTEILKVYKGRLIYRTYGQPYPLSEYLWNNGAGRLILDRPDFLFMPFHARSVDLEHDWLLDRMRVVPYQIDDDILDLAGTYEGPRETRIMVTCPNIDNRYYHAHYRHLKRHFGAPYYSYYGVQPRKFDDPQIVGTIPRAELMRHYQTSAGSLYTHGGPMVSYLPPIEMMTIGGPVISIRHNLLARMLPKDAPGLADNEDIARDHCRRLVEKDKVFAAEIIASQGEAARNYHRDYVNPIFDAAHAEWMAPERASPAPALIINAPPPARPASGRKRIYLLFHFPGSIVGRRESAYFSAEGIPRVARQFVEGLLRATDYEVVVTTTYGNAPFTMGYFGAKGESRVKVLVVDDFPAIRSHHVRTPSLPEKAFDALGKRWRYWSFRHLPVFLRNLPDDAARLAVSAFRRVEWRLARLLPRKHVPVATPVDVAKVVDSDPHAAGVIVPHYYLFPEAARMATRHALYLPDYTPHFFKGGKAFPGQEEHARIGKALCRSASVIISNSEFTRSYLAETELEVDIAKLRVFPLPNLNLAPPPDSAEPGSPVQNHVAVLARQRPILFYPTQNRPNKNIAFLLELLDGMIRDWAKIGPEGMEPPVLVLTCSLDDFPPVREAYQRLGMQPHVILVSGSSDADLRWIYARAAALVLTTTMEGNFPPQVLEALAYDTPVVAARIRLITDELGDRPDDLLLAEPMDDASFRAALLRALTDREAVIASQQNAYRRLMERRSPAYFGEQMAGIAAILDSAPAPQGRAG
ncbi:MAG: glycosyltransferase family 4 protein [Beijerinckiaceae bacterium]|nr:glycosyltransferase family 4 protein [Beijerinckiaceae bacterium]MCZ8298728.1 glycosyltransferase family 4 protein [Beijerinckiaceae bacterium]